MRKIISQGSNTVMEGVFTSPFVPPSPKVREPRNENRRKVRKSRRLLHRKRCVVTLMVLLTSTPVFAASPAVTVGQAMAGNDRVANVQPAGRYETLKRQQSRAKKSGRSEQADTVRVYLDDYQKVPQAVTRQRSTETVWLGQKKKSR